MDISHILKDAEELSGSEASEVYGITPTEKRYVDILKLHGKTITNRWRSRQGSLSETVVLYGEGVNPVVAKIYDSWNILHIKLELEAYKILQGFDNIVNKICDFTIEDEKTRWGCMKDSFVGECENKTDKLHFIILEYIDRDKIREFFRTKATKETIYSIMIQLILSISTMAYKYGIRHKNMRNGNILIDFTENPKLQYKIFDKQYSISTHGVIVKFVDYHVCFICKDGISIESVNTDIFYGLHALLSYVADEELKTKIRDFLINNMDNKNMSIDQIIMVIREAFVK